MDNPSAYRTEKVRGLVEGAGCELLYLTPPTQQIRIPSKKRSQKEKGILHRTGAPTLQALAEATGPALPAVNDEDTRSFFARYGYGTPVHSL